MLIFNKGSTNLLIAVLVDLHAQSVNERGIEAGKEREKENARGRLLHLLLLATFRKVTKGFFIPIQHASPSTKVKLTCLYMQEIIR